MIFAFWFSKIGLKYLYIDIDVINLKNIYRVYFLVTGNADMWPIATDLADVLK